MSRFVSLLAWAVLLVPTPLAAQVLRYRGETGEERVYVREQHDRVLQTVNARQLSTEIQSYWRLAATVSQATPEALTLEIIHDSLAVTGSPGAAGLDLSTLYGVPIEMDLSRRGAVSEIRAPDSLPPVAARLDLATTYRSFFPRLPEGEVGEGTTWADTFAVDATQNGLDLQVVRVTRYASMGWTTHGDRRVVRVDYESDLSIQGSGAQQEAGIVLSGTGEGTGGFSFDPEAGELVAGGETSQMRMVALVTAQGQDLVIPIVQNRSETVTLVEAGAERATE